MLQLITAGKRFGQKLLFEDVNWLITPDERTGLVGGNGTGKSTLLKILAGIESLDYGQLTRVKGMTIGYLPQDGLALRGKTVFAECLSVFDHLHALEAESIELMTTMSENDPKSKEYLAAAERYSDIADQLHVHDIYTLDSQVGAVLGGLGFSKEDWDRKTEEFSGGWQMRIALAKLLLQKPSLLLLDEPTNHLDLESRNWLEDYLHDYPNAFILISHDRYFLDVTVNKIVELWNKRMHVYHGNYEKYVTQKEERRTQLMNAYKNQRDRIEALEAFINRFRYQATKAKQVQSRIKELEKIERIEVPEEEATIHFTLSAAPGPGRTVIEVQNLTKVYPTPDGGQKTILDNAQLHHRARRPHRARRSQRRRQIDPHPPAQRAGRAHLGHDPLRPQRPGRLLRAGPVQGARPQRRDARRHRRRRRPRSRSSSCAACSAASCSPATTSSRSSACSPAASATATRWRRCWSRPRTSCCSTSRPTTSTCAPRTSCSTPSATSPAPSLFVSHDRYFIDGLATRVFEVEDRRVHIYPGNYEDYLWRKQGGPEKVKESLSAGLSAPAPVAAPVVVDCPGCGECVAAPVKRLNPIKLKQMEDRLKFAEERIPQLE